VHEMSAMKAGFDYLVKFMLVGDAGVGKTSLMLRFNDGTFTEEFSASIGVDFKVKVMKIDGKWNKVQTWDGYSGLRPRTYAHPFKDVSGFMIVYDITEQSSFDHVRFLIKEIAQESPNAVEFLIGNKSDLISQRVVEMSKGQELADEFGMHFFETSAKKDVNVTEAFTEIARQLIAKRIQHNEAAVEDAKAEADENWCSVL
jgi:small GTP-binding protein